MSFKPLKYLLVEIAAIMLLVILCTLALLISAALLNSWLETSDSLDMPKQQKIIQYEESNGNNP